MRNIWFTADTHFGHENIINLGKRPFSSVKEMDEVMIERWNERVHKDDIVWHLGDFAYKNVIKTREYFSRLNGVVYFTWGNHDNENISNMLGGMCSDMADINVDGHRLILCHYPMRTWDGVFRGSLHIHGHTHGTLPGTTQSLDIGVDCWDFRPVSLREIKERMSQATVLPEELERKKK